MDKIGVRRELEVKINQEWLWIMETRLFNEIQRTTLCDKEIVVEEIEKLAVVLIWNKPLSLRQLSHTTEARIG
jgi:hypothetical protein